MSDEQLLELIDSSLTIDTGSLVRDIALFAMVSPDPQAILNRFMVQGLTHCKDIQAPIDTTLNPQHEFVVVELEDTKQTTSKRLFIVLERTASSVRPSPSGSLALKAPLLASASISSLSGSLHSSDSLSPYKAVATDEFEPSPQGSPSHQLPFLDSASLASTRTLHTSTQSICCLYLADDHFLGAKHFENYAVSTLNIKQIRPQSLSLFELAVLADTIHNHDPQYSILKHQCFWFATTLCHVVGREYKCTMVTSSAPFVSRVDIRNSYLPEVGGRWRGFMINDVEDDSVLLAISANFRKHLEQKHDNVLLIFCSEYHLLKSRHR